MFGFYVFDLDGTLCDISHRLHYIKNSKKDWDSFYNECDKDVPKKIVIDILNLLHDKARIEIWSGRSDIVRDKTEEWLLENDVKYDKLLMRKHGDHRPDTVVKKEFLDSYLCKPAIIFDDRQTVVDMWRKNGIICFQVDQWDEMEEIGKLSENSE